MSNRTWSIARFPQEGMHIFVVLLWLGYFLVALGITVAIANFGTVGESVWENALSLPRVFAFIIGLWLTGGCLRLYVAHGSTRSEVLRKISVYLVVFAVLLGGLITLGFLLEWALYQATGWPHLIADDTLSVLATRILPTFAVVFGVWSVAGALINAGNRRLGGAGLLVTIPAAVALVTLTENGLDGPYLGQLSPIELEFLGAFPTGVWFGLAGFLIALAGTWALTRDVPIPSAGA